MSDLIHLEIDGETAVSLISAVERDVQGYTHDVKCCPPRVIKLRELLTELDEKLEEKVEAARREMKAEAEAETKEEEETDES